MQHLSATALHPWVMTFLLKPCDISQVMVHNPWTSLVDKTIKHLSTMWETRVQSLGREDSLEKEMATHSSTLAWKIPWTEELGAGYCPWGRKESGTTERLHFHFRFTHFLPWSEPWLGCVTPCPPAVHTHRVSHTHCSLADPVTLNFHSSSRLTPMCSLSCGNIRE